MHRIAVPRLVLLSLERLFQKVNDLRIKTPPVLLGNLH